MKIVTIEDSDNGDWVCQIVTDSKQTGKQTINLLVARAPTEVYLQSQTEQLKGSLYMNISVETNRELECIVKGEPRPEPKFKWFLDSEEVSTGSSKYEYFGELEHSGKHLKCEIGHEGFTQEDIKNGKNIAKVELEIVGQGMYITLSLTFKKLYVCKNVVY